MKVFIIHITEEARIAEVLRDWIESTFAGQVEVFVSSDPHDIPAGSKWLEKIDKALEEAVVFVVLCSPTSLARPWINFEMGCGWMKRVPVVPICHSGQKRGQLPSPVSMFQALEMESEGFIVDFFGSLATHLGIKKLPRIDQSAMKGELGRALQGMVKESEVVAGVAPAEGVTKGELDESAQAVLKKIADMGDAGYPAETLARLFNITRPKMQYYLDSLVDGKFLYRTLFVGEPPAYSLTKEGRSYLVQKGLL